MSLTFALALKIGLAACPQRDAPSDAQISSTRIWTRAKPFNHCWRNIHGPAFVTPRPPTGLFGELDSTSTANALVAAESPRVGRKIEHFKLDDFRGRSRSLGDWKDSKLIVVAFLGTECPLANLYAPRLSRAWRRSMRIRAWLSSPSTRINKIRSRKWPRMPSGMEFKFPVLKDPANKIADQFGAVRTPEVFVLDADRVVRYWGRIDDQYGVGYQKAEGRPQ